MKKSKVIIPGINVFIENSLRMFTGKRVALLSNNASRDKNLTLTIDLLLNYGLNIVKLFAPEHGITGTKEAGVNVNSVLHPEYKLPVISLYDQAGNTSLLNVSSVDESMRLFDTIKEGKSGPADLLSGVDTVIVDLQDVGTRVYTYVATLFFLMERCAKEEVEMVVLDRPNPLNGIVSEGPVLKYPEFSSFIGVAPVPLRHSLTIGELALFFNKELMKKRAELKVIPMDGWSRNMNYDKTGLYWINPSPNLPSINSASVYPGQVLFEGTNISEGRGTTLPFEQIGAPWIKGSYLIKHLNEIAPGGVKFLESYFTPSFSKYAGKSCSGIRIVITDINVYRPFYTAILIISEIMKIYPDEFFFYESYFDHVCGNAEIREKIENKTDPGEIVEDLNNELKDFSHLKQEFLLY